MLRSALKGEIKMLMFIILAAISISDIQEAVTTQDVQVEITQE